MSGAHMSVPATLADHGACPATDVLQRVGDRWSVLVMALLERRSYRFNEMHRALEGSSQRMLTRTLRSLERDGLVSRTVHPTVPPSVEYALTGMGEEFRELVHALGEWAVRREPDMTAARARYDAG